MKSVNLQNKLDILIEKIFFKAIPEKIKPNHLTLVRFLLLPLIYWLFRNNYNLAGLVVFSFAVSTDFLDGALARRKNQITDLGKIIDPVADKLLIGLMLFIIGTEYLIIKIFLTVILIEIIANIVSGFAYKVIGRPMGANIFGKIKMILQSIAIIAFATGLILNSDILIMTSEWTLLLALLFALLAGAKQIYIKKDLFKARIFKKTKLL